MDTAAQLAAQKRMDETMEDSQRLVDSWDHITNILRESGREQSFMMVKSNKHEFDRVNGLRKKTLRARQLNPAPMAVHG